MSTEIQKSRHVSHASKLRWILAVAVFGLSAGALAQPVSFGTGCTFSGNTLAQGGPVGAILGNDRSFTGTTCSGGTAESRGTVYGARWTGDDYFDYSFAQRALTDAGATAGFGTLRASSHSAAQSSPKEWWYTDNTGESRVIVNEYLAYGTSSATASWYDRLVVDQGTAPYGPIVLRYTLQLSGSEGITLEAAGKADIHARFIVDDDRNISDRTISLDAPGTYSFTAGYFPGTEIKLYGDLTATTEVRAGGRYLSGSGGWIVGNYIAEAEATANASNTAGFQIEVLTVGAGYSTDSGRTYITMVPEPSSVAMFGFGGALVLLAAMRRRAA